MEVGLLSKLQGNMTVFVPTNEAVEEFHRNLMEFNTLELENPEKNEVTYNVDDGLGYDYRKKREIVIADAPTLQDNLLSHLTSGFVSVQQMQDEGLLPTEDTTGGQIRTTVYRTKPEKVVMANCARITARDILATNGIVHVVDKMIQPATNSLGQILNNDFGFAKFSRARVYSPSWTTPQGTSLSLLQQTRLSPSLTREPEINCYQEEDVEQPSSKATFFQMSFVRV